MCPSLGRTSHSAGVSAFSSIRIRGSTLSSSSRGSVLSSSPRSGLCKCITHRCSRTVIAIDMGSPLEAMPQGGGAIAAGIVKQLFVLE